MICLKKLALNECSDITNFEPLTKLINLEQLYLVNVQISNYDLKHFFLFSNLNLLYIKKCNVTLYGVVLFLSSIKNTMLRSVYFQSDDFLVDEDMMELKNDSFSFHIKNKKYVI